MTREPVPPDTSTPTQVAAEPAARPHLWLVPQAPAPTLLAPADALVELDALLARPARDDHDLARLAALAAQVPGRRRAVVAALADASTGPALDALLTLTHVPGAPEALARALARGVTRRLPGGADAPAFLALDFRASRARPLPDLLRRAQLLAADPSGALELEVLRVDERPRYRLAFWAGRLPPRPRAALARACEPDLTHLHARLARLRGARLWLSGFCLPAEGPVSPALQAHLLAAFFTWAKGHDP